jgi:hypothetical protein
MIQSFPLSIMSYVFVDIILFNWQKSLYEQTCITGMNYRLLEVSCRQTVVSAKISDHGQLHKEICLKGKNIIATH